MHRQLHIVKIRTALCKTNNQLLQTGVNSQPVSEERYHLNITANTVKTCTPKQLLLSVQLMDSITVTAEDSRPRDVDAGYCGRRRYRYRCVLVPFVDARVLADGFLPLMTFRGFLITPFFLLPGFFGAVFRTRLLTASSNSWKRLAYFFTR